MLITYDRRMSYVTRTNIYMFGNMNTNSTEMLKL